MQIAQFKFDENSFQCSSFTFIQLSSLKFCLALCKIFYEGKIKSIENIFGKGK